MRQPCGHFRCWWAWWRWFISAPRSIFIGGKYYGGAALNEPRDRRWLDREPCCQQARPAAWRRWWSAREGPHA